MIAITSNENLLPKSDLEEHFSEIAPGEEWKVYDNVEAMLEDKERIDILLNSIRVKPELFKEFANLRWIFSYIAGVDSYPLDLFREREIILTNSSGVHSKNMAEQVIGAMIMISRNFITAGHNRRKKIFAPIPTDELFGRKLLILGPGAIGRELARKAKAFDMYVIGVRNRAVDEPIEHFDEVHRINALDELLPEADFVVSILPSTEKTINLFDKSKFSLMHRKAAFINVGRGTLVVEADLAEVLQNKQIRAAYLDVFQEEPLPADSPLWELDNLIITPHNAGTTPFYFDRAMGIFKENLRRFRAGEEMLNVISYEDKY